jgi:hypothetical protein
MKHVRSVLVTLATLVAVALPGLASFPWGK